MILLEYAAQGVRGVAPGGGRAALRPGYNVVAADGPALRRLLESLVHPDPRDAEALPRPPGVPAGAPVRAGLTLLGNDRVTYRIVRDYAAGAQLHRFDPARRAFALVAQDLPGIQRFLREVVGVPGPRRLAALLSISAAELPSRQAAAHPTPAIAPRPALTPEQARRRLLDLRGELERARTAERLQSRLDVLQQRVFAADEALKAGARTREGLQQAEAARTALAPAARAVAALGDPAARVAAFERAAAKRDEALAKAAAEREAMGDPEALPAPPPWRGRTFWGGVGAGALLLALGVAGALRGSGLRYAALLDLPAFGWSAWEALRWIGGLERAERVARRRRVVDDWERKALEAFARDTADVTAAVQALGVAKPAEVVEAATRIADADAVVAEWQRRLAEWEASPEAQDARAERSRIDAELQEVERALQAAAGGFLRDSRTVEAELQRLEAEAVAPPAPPAAPAAQASVEPIRGLLTRAAAELGGTPAAALLAVAPRASLALAGLSFNRLGGVTADGHGNPVVQAAGRPTPALSLPPAERDLVWLALKLAFLEQALSGGPTVALLDDPFAGLPEGARRLAARLLKGMARGGQVVHATADVAFREAADHAA